MRFYRCRPFLSSRGRRRGGWNASRSYNKISSASFFRKIVQRIKTLKGNKRRSILIFNSNKINPCYIESHLYCWNENHVPRKLKRTHSHRRSPYIDNNQNNNKKSLKLIFYPRYFLKLFLLSDQIRTGSFVPRSLPCPLDLDPLTLDGAHIHGL